MHLLPKSCRGKLVLLGIIIGLMVLVNSLLIYEVIRTNSRIDNLSYPTVSLAKEMELSVTQVQQYLSDISATRAQDGKDDGFKNAEENAEKFRAALEKFVLLRPEKADWAKQYGQAFDEYYELGKKMAQAYISYGPSAGNKLMPQFDEKADQLEAYTREVGEASEQEMDRSLAKVDFELKLVLGIMLASGLITIALSLAITRCIVSSLRAILKSVERDQDGHITLKDIQLASGDEFGELALALGTVLLQVQGFVKQVGASTEQLAASSQQLTANADQSAQASNHIASAIAGVAQGAAGQLNASNQAALIVEQMAANIQSVAASVSQVAAQSAQAADTAREGGRTVDQAVAQMGQIENTVNTSARVVATLGERSKEIGQIIDTIAGIAGQTNLLALNAAIEAARAGEQGRGFAVVAEEVRKLAEQSQEAAQKIADLIGEIQGDTERAVVAMNDGTREVKTGAEAVNRSGLAFKEIVGLVTQVSGQVKEIAATVGHIAASSQQIVGSVKEIDELSRKSADESQSVSAASEEQLASMEEIATSSEALAKLAQELRAAVATFRI